MKAYKKVYSDTITKNQNAAPPVATGREVSPEADKRIDFIRNIVHNAKERD